MVIMGKILCVIGKIVCGLERSNRKCKSQYLSNILGK